MSTAGTIRNFPNGDARAYNTSVPTSLTPPAPDALPPAQRERVVDVLTRHFANDELTEAELDARLQRVYAATTTPELEAIIADLPAFAGPETRPVPAQFSGTEIAALFSGQERRLTDVVPRDLRLRARLGYVELDLTQARFEPGVTTIDVRTFMGYVEIRLPAGVRVESLGRALFGYFAVKDSGASGASADAPSVVRITGRAAVGYTEVFLVPS